MMSTSINFVSTELPTPRISWLGFWYLPKKCSSRLIRWRHKRMNQTGQWGQRRAYSSSVIYTRAHVHTTISAKRGESLGRHWRSIAFPREVCTYTHICAFVSTHVIHRRVGTVERAETKHWLSPRHSWLTFLAWTSAREYCCRYPRMCRTATRITTESPYITLDVRVYILHTDAICEYIHVCVCACIRIAYMIRLCIYTRGKVALQHCAQRRVIN